MGNVKKGTIAGITGNDARIIPVDPKETVSISITIPKKLREKLDKGVEVIYAEFSDHTGIILCRADGEDE